MENILFNLFGEEVSLEEKIDGEGKYTTKVETPIYEPKNKCPHILELVDSVMTSPSCVKVKSMGVSSKRLHHSISWENAVPCIVRKEHKKTIMI